MQWRPKSTTASTQRPPQRREAPAPTPAPARRQSEPVPKPRSKKKKERAAKLSRMRKPENMSLEDWQVELRRQFGRSQKYRLKNTGDHPIFSAFEVQNPETKGVYRVHIRGRQLGDNFCSCPDFATNTLGTCKHIEFTLAALERKRDGAAQLRNGFQPSFSEIYLQYGAQREVRFRPGTEAPVALSRLAGKYFDADGSLRADAFARFDDFLREALNLEPELRYHEDVIGFIAEVRDGEERKRRVAEAFPRGIRSAAFKDLLKVELYDYQKEAALFAARAGRTLIGDEMGLGKTIQAIAVAEVMARLQGVERVLIVCPTSLKHQWQREIERCSPRPTTVIGGEPLERARQFACESFFKIMNYDTVWRDLELIQKWAPDLVILDEAQRIKNWNTRTARSVKRITSPYAVVLTGTPLENRLEELISIVQFVDRFRLGPTFRLLHEHQIRDDVGKVVGYRNLDQLGQTLEPILIRRHKNEVLDQLPERIDNNIFVPMTDLQGKYHRENMEIVARVVQKWRRYGFLTEADQRRLMIALQRMRMACDSSYLVDHRTDHGHKAGEAVTLLDEIFETPDTKVVVFSQWIRMHELIVRRFKDRGWGFVLFHGGVPGTKRKDLIDRFREDPNCRAFLSTDAGGVGLNLQHANVVFNMDLPWNPAVLEQRVGRVHRMGQKQPVRVVNFIAQGTIEEGMLSVLKFKKSLFAGVLDGGEKEVFLGGSRLNKFMETVESATAAIPDAMIEDAEEALRGPQEPEPSRAARRRGRPTPVESDDEIETLTPSPVTVASDPWGALLQTGMALLQQVATAARPSTNTTSAVAARGPTFIARDERTGEQYIRLPMPPPEVVDQALKAFGALLQGFKR